MQHSKRFLEIVNAAKRLVHETHVKAVRERMQRGETFVLVDVREDNEWDQGHLPGAMHLGKGIIERDVEKAIPGPDTDIVLYCGGGYRSALAAENLQRMGYTRVTSMDGGYKGWVAAGLPIERDT